MDTLLASLAALDTRLLNTMRAWIDPDTAWISTLIHVFADIEVIFTMAFLVGLWLYAAVRRSVPYRRESLLLFYGIAVSFAVYVALNLGLPMRARPETVLAVRPIIDHLPDNSFPSGHAIFAAASGFGAYIFLTVRRGLWVPIFVVSGLLMCIARIFAGVHYPFDIAAGYVVGLAGPALVLWASSSCAVFDRVFVAPVIRLARFFRL